MASIKKKLEFNEQSKSFSKIIDSNPRDRLEIEIGDSKDASTIHPQVKLMRWDNEFNFSLRLKTDSVKKFSESKEVIKWENDEYKVDLYQLPDAYEFEITLTERPKKNIIEFSLNTKGLDFYYQPTLIEEIGIERIVTATETHGYDKDGNLVEYRPENVVKSYAVYCKETPLNIAGQKEYRAGKVAHIYRPRIEDSAGNWIWGELSIDAEKGTLTVTIPEDFLDNAIYPIRHASGLTIGTTTAGGTTSSGWTTGDCVGSWVGTNPATDVYPQSINIYTVTANKNLKGFAMAYVSDYAFISNSTTQAGVSLASGWSILPNNLEPHYTDTGGTDYIEPWVVFGSTSSDFKRDTTGTDQNSGYGTTSYTTPSGVGSYSGTSYKYSIYMVYSATQPPISPVTITKFSTSVTSMAVNLPSNISSGDLLLAFVEVRNSGTWTPPTDWIEFDAQLGGGSVGELTAFYKIATGSEGSTATWTASTGTTAVWQTRRVPSANWDGTTAPESDTASGDSSSANPPNLTPSWGSADTLWLAVAGHTASSISAFTAPPTNYDDFVNAGASSEGSAVSLATSYREYTGSSEDPSTFTIGGSNRWWASMTVAIRPPSAGTLDDDSRDSRVIGKASSTSDRDSKVSGKSTSSSDRDSKVLGKVSASDSRDSKVKGLDTVNSSRDSKVLGKATSSNSRDSKTTGQASDSSFRDAKISGKDSISNSRDSHVIGKIVESDSRDSKVKGVDTSSDNRDSKVIGKTSDSDSRDSKVQGILGADSSRDSKVHGVDSANSSRDSKITGSESSSDNKDSRVIGIESANDSRGVTVKGKNSANSSRNAVVTGNHGVTNERQSRLSGINSDSSSRDSRVLGNQSESNSRNSKVSGETAESSSRSSKVSGGSTESNSRVSRASGKAIASSASQARVLGSEVSNDSRDSKTIGNIKEQSSRNSKLKSVGTASSSRNSKLTSAEDVSNARSSKVTGSTQSSSSRKSVVVGKRANVYDKTEATWYDENRTNIVQSQGENPFDLGGRKIFQKRGTIISRRLRKTDGI